MTLFTSPAACSGIISKISSKLSHKRLSSPFKCQYNSLYLQTASPFCSYLENVSIFHGCFHHNTRRKYTSSSSSKSTHQQNAPMMPLSGITVLDLTRVLAGPFASQNLADLGAEVIKVEHLETGDDTRQWGPPWWKDPNQPEESSAYFATCNRSKKSLALNLKTQQGKDIIRELVSKHASIFMENFSTGVTERLDLDYDSLKQYNQDLIYASISGFGRTGEYRNRPGYDFLIQAASGIMHLTGEPERDPQKIGMAMVDVLTGQYVTQAILASLVARKGQFIDVSLYDSALAALVNQAQNYLATNVSPQRMGNEHPNIAPYELFQCMDGPLIITVGNDHQFLKLAEFLQIPQNKIETLFATNALRLKNRQELKSIIQEAFMKQKRDYWVKHLTILNIPCGPVNDVKEAFESPPTRDRDMLWEFPDSPIRVVGNPIKYSETKIEARNATPPPQLGQHTREILRDVLNYSNDKIAELQEKKVVRCHE